MTHYIMDNCVVCGTCWDLCPVDAVEEFEDFYKINNRCDDCGKCVKACPNHAIANSVSRGEALERHHAEVEGREPRGSSTISTGGRTSD